MTRFDITTYPILNIQYAINVYNAADVDNLVKESIAVHEAMKSDPKIGLFTNFRRGVVIVGMLYADQPSEEPKAFAGFRALPSLLQTILPPTNGTLAGLVQTLDQFHPPKEGK